MLLQKSTCWYWTNTCTCVLFERRLLPRKTNSLCASAMCLTLHWSTSFFFMQNVLFNGFFSLLHSALRAGRSFHACLLICPHLPRSVCFATILSSGALTPLMFFLFIASTYAVCSALRMSGCCFSIILIAVTARWVVFKALEDIKMPTVSEILASLFGCLICLLTCLLVYFSGFWLCLLLYLFVFTWTRGRSLSLGFMETMYEVNILFCYAILIVS